MDFIIVSVGNELLSGDIVNTNSAYIARKLTHYGHKVLKMITLPDDVDHIAEDVAEAKQKSDFVLVTGGLGVTHDDVTAEGIAKATKRELVLNQEAYSFLRTRMKNEEAMKKMATLPEGSEIINNVVGAAPGFIVENIAVMPGVPAEMEYMMEKLLERYGRSDYFEERLEVGGYEDRICPAENYVRFKHLIYPFRIPEIYAMPSTDFSGEVCYFTCIVEVICGSANQPVVGFVEGSINYGIKVLTKSPSKSLF